MIGRERMRERIAREGLALSDLDGSVVRLPGHTVPYLTDPAALQGAGLVLVTVKSGDSEAAAHTIARHASPEAVIVSLQNGVGNADTLRTLLPGRTVLAGMVPFNVVQTPDGRLHRGTEGAMMVESSPAIAGWCPLFARAGVPLVPRDDFAAVQWGKLLLNLNNAINALAGIPLRDELSRRGYRRCLAALQTEALQILKAAGITPAKVARLGPALLPHVLRLPDVLFHRVAATMLRIDPEARSSMWEDLQHGRKTEVDYLNGAVVRLAQSIGRDAPLNRRMVELVHLAEAGRMAALSDAALLSALDAKVAPRPAIEEGTGQR